MFSFKFCYIFIKIGLPLPFHSLLSPYLFPHLPHGGAGAGLGGVDRHPLLDQPTADQDTELPFQGRIKNPSFLSFCHQKNDQVLKKNGVFFVVSYIRMMGYFRLG